MPAGASPGTTFLLTDIEGSTRRWEADPDRMAVLLEEHDAAIEKAVASFNGEVIRARGEGDSTFAVFGDPVGAVESALACQLVLLGELGLPVRMAIHTDRVGRSWGFYYGPPANRTARLRSLASGGRVLLSEAAAGAVEANLPAGCSLVDLGIHLLRDLQDPEHIFGLSHPRLPQVVAPRASGSRPAMVGRLQELSTLREVLGEAQVAGLRVATIVGDGGIGKTRLAEELGREACAMGGRLVWATARSDNGAPPFALWNDVLRRLSDADTRWSSEPLDREDRIDRVVAAIRNQAADRLLVLVLDDLQLADPSSLGLLRRVSAESDLGKVLLVALSRPTALDHPARQAMAELARRSEARRIQLGELSGFEAARVVSGYAPDLDPPTVQKVVRHAGGNPLFLRECATAVSQRPGAAAMPETVRVAIAERLATLDPRVVRVLQSAAVAGRTVPEDVVAAASGEDQDGVLSALDKAQAVGLVAQAAVGEHSWSFTHDLVREAIAHNMGPARRAAAHAAVARSIEQLRSADLASHAAEIAAHLSEASPQEWHDAVVYGELATATALKAGAFEEAIDLCRRALERCEASGADPAVKARLLILLGRALTATDIQAAGEAILGAILVARSLGDQELLLAAVTEFPFDMGAIDARALAELHAAIRQLGDSDPRTTSLLHGLLAFHYFTSRQWEDQEREASLAWELSRQVKDPTARFFAALARLLTIWGGAGADQRRIVLDECTWAGESCGDPANTLKGRFMRARPYVEMADRQGLDATVALLEEGVGGHVATYSKWVVSVWRTMQATLDGDLGRAEDLLERTRSLGAAAAGQVAVAAHFHQQVMLRFQQGRLPEMLEGIRRFEAMWGGHPLVLGWLALALAESGQRVEAQVTLRGLDEDGFELVPAQLCFALPSMAEAAVALAQAGVGKAGVGGAGVGEAGVGGAGVAGRLAAALKPHAGNVLAGFGIASTCYGAADRYLGRLAVLMGEFDAALGHHRAAARLHRRLGSRLWELHSRLDTAEALLARRAEGDSADAAQLVSSVVSEATGTQMVAVLRRASALAGA